MTRKEAIEHGKEQLEIFGGEHAEFIRMAIKALEQEPLLDKIRAEIKSLSNANPSYWHSGDMVYREEVLDIIDKYKESEE